MDCVCVSLGHEERTERKEARDSWASWADWFVWYGLFYFFVLIDIEQDWRAGGVKKGRIES